MAIVYSWGLGKNRIGYIIDPKNNDKALVTTTPISKEDLDFIKSWTSNIDPSDEDDALLYKNHFNDLKAKVPEIDFGDVSVYLNIDGDCASLVGPRGPRGFKGDPGNAGPAGPKGEAGPRGTRGLGMREVTAYLVCDNPTLKPNKPEGGSWDQYTNEVTYPEKIDEVTGEKWGPEREAVDNEIVWTSHRIFYADDEFTTSWGPVNRITGKDGKPGEDGKNIEFIYFREPNDAGTDPMIPEKDAKPDIDGSYVAPDGTVWYQSPKGISFDMRVEWYCSRVKDKDGNWLDWEGPVRWSRWGDKGQDGDGVEYVFYINNGITPVGEKDPSNIDPDSEIIVNGKKFQDDEFVPEGWTDDMSGVEEGNKKTHEWVSIRKKKNGKWAAFSTPKIWAHYGENGFDGTSVKTVFHLGDESGEAPKINNNSEDPGPGWYSTMFKIPETKGRLVWGSQAYFTHDNKFAETEDPEDKGWCPPYPVIGINGKDGSVPRYSTDWYHLEGKNGETPEAPTSVKKMDQEGREKMDQLGWKDYPNSGGRWYKVIGSVDGYTLDVSWGDVRDTEGKPGKDGSVWERRVAVAKDRNKTGLPALNKESRNPNAPNALNPDFGSGWVLPSNLPETVVLTGDETMYETSAEIILDQNGNEVLKDGSVWGNPWPISGIKGERGGTGPSGIPGVNIDLRFKVGPEEKDIIKKGDKWYYPTEDPKNLWWDNEWSDVCETFDKDGVTHYGPDSFGWVKKAPEEYLDSEYIWAIQARTRKESGEEGSSTIFDTVGDTWSTPFRMTGLRGLSVQGEKGPLIYPAGVYENKKLYFGTEKKIPYVWDTASSKFYLFKAVGNDNAWYGGTKEDPDDLIATDIIDGEQVSGVTQKGRSPKDDEVHEYWSEFETYEAIFAQVGIIQNGLIGECVFNNQFMFSQSGIGPSGEEVSGKLEEGSTEGNKTSHYEYFLDKYTYDADSGLYVTIEGGDRVKNPDPYKKVNGKFCGFRPNLCMNFSTGEAWFGRGGIHITEKSEILWGQYETNNPLQDLINADSKNASNIEKVNSVVTGHTMNIEKLNSGLDTTNGRVDGLDSSLGKTNQKVDDLGTSLDKTNTSIAEIEKDISGMSSDNLITSIEKRSLVTTFRDIENEYKEIQGNNYYAQVASALTDTFKTRFKNLKNYLCGLDGEIDLPKEGSILYDQSDFSIETYSYENKAGRVGFNLAFKNYFDSREALLIEINSLITNDISNNIEKYNNLTYLSDNLGNSSSLQTDGIKGIVLGSLLSVRNEAGYIRSFINGDSSIGTGEPIKIEGSEEVKYPNPLSFAAGVSTNTGITLNERANIANARIYEDGTTYLAKGTAVFNPDGKGHIGIYKEKGYNGKDYPIEWDSTGTGLDGGVSISKDSILGAISVDSLETIPPKGSEAHIVIKENQILAYPDKPDIVGQKALMFNGENLYEKEDSQHYKGLLGNIFKQTVRDSNNAISSSLSINKDNGVMCKKNNLDDIFTFSGIFTSKVTVEFENDITIDVSCSGIEYNTSASEETKTNTILELKGIHLVLVKKPLFGNEWEYVGDIINDTEYSPVNFNSPNGLSIKRTYENTKIVFEPSFLCNYGIYFYVEANGNWDVKYLTDSVTNISLSSNILFGESIGINISEKIYGTEIGANGLRVIYDSSHIAEFCWYDKLSTSGEIEDPSAKKKVKFALSCNGNKIEVVDDGIFLQLGNGNELKKLEEDSNGTLKLVSIKNKKAET